MGKSTVMLEIARLLQTNVISAPRFMRSVDPKNHVVIGKPLLIDGLDEAVARSESDAIDTVFAKLEAAGCPDFILSCRSREWQLRINSIIVELYKVVPTILELEKFGESEARAFLLQQFNNRVEPEKVLIHLYNHGITELYSNPLTLGLLGRVAELDTNLPSSKSALFERVCTLIWSEHDPERQESELGKLSEVTALSSAGALMAGMLFAGADAISRAAPLALEVGDIRLADLGLLGEATAISAIFSSKLFRNVGASRVAPIHRVIAEFLGARWLAQLANFPRAQRRLLAQFQGSGNVPASLRGLHAWLALHSSEMSKQVISADPFGVLRYSDSSKLTAEQAHWLFDSLKSLVKTDPYFRAQDWTVKTAIGLMIPSLRDKIEEIITSNEDFGHFRLLLISALKNTSIANDFTAALKYVMYSEERNYAEREDVFEVLFIIESSSYWQQVTEELHKRCTNDSLRLALHIIQKTDCDISDELLVTILLFDIGILLCFLGEGHNSSIYTYRNYDNIARKLPASRLINILNLMCDLCLIFMSNSTYRKHQLSDFLSMLMVRGIDSGVIDTVHDASMWKWLGVVHKAYVHMTSNKELLERKLDEHQKLRRAIQDYGLYRIHTNASIRILEVELNNRLIGLRQRQHDVIWLLNKLPSVKGNEVTRQEWRDLMGIGYRAQESNAELLEIGRRIIGGDQQLEHYLYRLENPKSPSWERKRIREEKKRLRRERVEKEVRRRHYSKIQNDLRIGDINAILEPAQCYLGAIQECSRSLPNLRISEWLNVDVQDDVLSGFEATLQRSDLLSPTQIAEDFAHNQTFSDSFAILAGLLARLRAGTGFSDLSLSILLTGLLICYDDRHRCSDEDIATLMSTLEALIISTEVEMIDFVRLWIEPSIIAHNSHVSGLHMLAREKRWHPAGTVLAAEWLNKYTDLPSPVELGLVECLTYAGDLDALAEIAGSRAKMVFTNDERRLTWLAIDMLVRFDIASNILQGIGIKNPKFIWCIRNIFLFQRHGSMVHTSITQAERIFSEFRTSWPYASLIGRSSGDTNPHDATDFLVALINRIAGDTEDQAGDALARLSEVEDSYTNFIRHMAAEQSQKRTEERFSPLLPKALFDVLHSHPPVNMDDLKSIVLEELDVAQKILSGDDLDQVRDFWNDKNVPYPENRCRDRMAALIGSRLEWYGIQRITEADMPQSKRADLAFASGQLQLPMEVKGQWHDEVWHAATDQLAQRYLNDWRSEQRGIYCVLWFGDLPFATGRRLKPPPGNRNCPSSSIEMREMLVAAIPEARRTLISVVVLDLSAGRVRTVD